MSELKTSVIRITGVITSGFEEFLSREPFPFIPFSLPLSNRILESTYRRQSILSSVTLVSTLFVFLNVSFCHIFISLVLVPVERRYVHDDVTSRQATYRVNNIVPAVT